MREPLRDKERLAHMLAAAERVIRYTSGKTFDDLKADDMPSLRTLRLSASYANRVNYSYDISYTKDNGVGSISQSNVFGSGFSWDGTYGPFKKNDKIKLSCSASIAMDITASISVSRNQEPFAIKAEFRKSSKECLLEYTIDF
jgi:hypothetical protein